MNHALIGLPSAASGSATGFHVSTPHSRGRRRGSRTWLAIFAAAAIAACASNPVTEHRLSPGALEARSALSAYSEIPQISDRSQALLDTLALPVDGDVAANAAALEQPIEGVREQDRLLALAEFYYVLADASDGVEAESGFLACACVATLAATEPAGKEPHGRQRSVHSLDPLRHEAVVAASQATTRFLASCFGRAGSVRELMDLHSRPHACLAVIQTTSAATRFGGLHGLGL